MRSKCCASIGLLIWLIALPPTFAQDAPRELAASMSADRSSVAPQADQGPVAIPEPTDVAVRLHRTNNIVWVVLQAWFIAVPAIFVFTGLSARIRNWARKVSQRWPVTLGIYLAIYMSLSLAANLPLFYYGGYVVGHRYGFSTQTFGRWLENRLKSLVAPPTSLSPPPPIMLPGLLLGFVFVLLLYWLLKMSPKRWWLYMGLSLVPSLFFQFLIQPIWFDPLFHRFGPMSDKTLEAEILGLVRRGGLEGGRVFVVDMSRDTKAANAYVTGIMGSKRIVLWDTAIAQFERRELMSTVAHEMGHFVLGHTVWRILAYSCALLVVFGLVHWQAGLLIGRFNQRFGFERLDDIASLPLILLLANLSLLVIAPAPLAYARHTEHEADRFALEMTRDNHAFATAELKMVQSNLNVPRHGWVSTLWRGTHPASGDRIDFANAYQPWQTGQPLKYAHLFK